MKLVECLEFNTKERIVEIVWQLWIKFLSSSGWYSLELLKPEKPFIFYDNNKIMNSISLL